MTWVKLDDSALDDPRLLELERGAILMHLEALAFSNRHGLDGAIARRALRKLTTEADPEAAAAALVAAGLWEVTDTGWQLVWLLDDQPGAAETAASRQAARTRQERHRRHVADDHSLCDPKRCWAMLRVTRDTTRNGTGDTTPPPSRPDPSRPDHKRRDGRGDRAGGARSRDGARAARRQEEARSGPRCWRCGHRAPVGLELTEDGSHPLGDVDDGILDDYPDWAPYVVELEGVDSDGSRFRYGVLQCPPLADGFANCLDCGFATPLDEMSPVRVLGTGANGEPTTDERYRCSDCQRLHDAEMAGLIGSSGEEAIA